MSVQVAQPTPYYDVNAVLYSLLSNIQAILIEQLFSQVSRPAPMSRRVRGDVPMPTRTQHRVLRISLQGGHGWRKDQA
jgi:Asp-tRNA(Asn)/Glu-tRNA(Gln) amidotransferase C subunit